MKRPYRMYRFKKLVIKESQRINSLSHSESPSSTDLNRNLKLKLDSQLLFKHQ